MYSHIGRFTPVEGRENDLLQALVAAARQMIGTSGLIEYQIFSSDDGAVWAVEIWVTRADHDASLDDQTTKDLISSVRPLIASAQANQLTFQGGLCPDGQWVDANLNPETAGH